MVMPIFDVEQQISLISEQLNNSSDFSSRSFEKQTKKVGLVFLKSIIDQQLFVEGVYEPLIATKQKLDFASISTKILKVSGVEEIEPSQAIEKILQGNVVVLMSDSPKYIAVDIQKYPARTPSEPPTSAVIQGPREGFTEDIKTNITLIRRRFYTQHLVLKEMNVGKYSNTKVVMAYLKGIANDKVVKEIEKRLQQINIDGIIDSYYILKFLEKNPQSLFKQVGGVEKPDIIAAKMLEGRVAIMVDGSPIVLSVPFLFLEEVQASNDYYSSHIYSSFIRIVRILAILIAVIVPGTYVALRIFHQNVIPIKFLITITNTTKGLPFTPFLEMLFVDLLFQILYEVSLRLPSYLGLATSIVGALILGDTGVKAGLLSPPAVIIIAIAKIALYTVPEESYQLTILQHLFLFVGGSLGLFGIVGLMIYIVVYLASIDSYGAPYLAPFAPRVDSDLKDALIKETVNNMKTRPQSFSNKNKTRQK